MDERALLPNYKLREQGFTYHLRIHIYAFEKSRPTLLLGQRFLHMSNLTCTLSPSVRIGKPGSAIAK